MLVISDPKTYLHLPFHLAVWRELRRDLQSSITVGEQIQNLGVVREAVTQVDLVVHKPHQDLHLSVTMYYSTYKDNIQIAQFLPQFQTSIQSQTTIQIRMFLWLRKIFKNCPSQVELMQSVEGPHLSHKNGLTLLIKHVLPHHRHLQQVQLPKLRQEEDVKVVCNRLLNISIAHLISLIQDTLVPHR